MRKILLALLLSLWSGLALAADNYNATPGTGLVFGAKDATSVYYPRHILCDNTTVAQCMSIDASGRPTVNINGTVTVTGTVAATQSGTWTVQPGNTANTTPWLASISQGGSTAVVKAANTVASTDVGVVVAVANTLAPGYALSSVASPVIPSFPTLVGNAPLVKGTTAAMTGTTSTQIIASVASNRIYATRVSCKGDPANAVATKVLIQDGSGGTTLDTLSVAASGGGEQATGATPLFWTTSGNGLFAQNVTTSSSVICTASGYSG